MKRVLTAVALAALLAGCATPGVYRPSEGGGAGYAETQIESDRYSVRFRGDWSTPRDRVEAYALHRAAEITLAAGQGHFRIVDRDVDEERRVVATAPVGGFSEFSYFRRTPVGFGFGTSAATARPITRYEAFLEVVVAPGPAPDGDPDAYDAAEVVALVGPIVRRPG